MAKLDRELVGLKPVKTRIREIAALLLVDRLRRKFGISSDTPTLHMNFTGNPGHGQDHGRACGWPKSCTGSATSAKATWCR